MKCSLFIVLMESILHLQTMEFNLIVQSNFAHESTTSIDANSRSMENVPH
jgi:hypothetical protein